MFVEAYAADGDIHQLVAGELGLIRDVAKRMNLGVVYTLGADGLSRKAKIPLSQAREFLNKYHQRAPEIRRLQRKCESLAKRDGYIKMWTGRRKRYVNDWEYRKAMSGLIQGGVAEIMRYANVRLHPWVQPLPDLKMLLQVHDEILFMGREGRREEYIPRIMDDMQRFDFRCPIKVECKIGPSWGEMQPWKK
jgi:DNA polymerase-1